MQFHLSFCILTMHLICEYCEILTKNQNRTMAILALPTRKNVARKQQIHTNTTSKSNSTTIIYIPLSERHESTAVRLQKVNSAGRLRELHENRT